MPQDREEALTLEILNAIEARSDVTQRHLADRLGVALGLANSYLKRCVRKGLVKITQAPANRYLYYLTPQGFSEKSRLTGQYLSASIDFYRQASASLVDALRQCREAGHERIIFVGVSELAEIAAIRSQDVSLIVLGTYDTMAASNALFGKPVWRRLDAVPPCDGAVLTALSDCAARYAEVLPLLGPTQIVVPGIVRPLLPADQPRALGAAPSSR